MTFAPARLAGQSNLLNRGQATKLLVFAVLTLFAVQPEAAKAADNTALELANLLSGTFVGSTPNNNLRLDIQQITNDPLHRYDLFLSVTGTFEATTVRQQGVIRLESQGNGVYFGYVPHFDPTITALSPKAGRFNEREADAACGFTLSARGDGFAGETLGSSCAIALRGAIRKWTVEIEPGSIRLQDARSGETLRFRKLERAAPDAKAKN